MRAILPLLLGMVALVACGGGSSSPTTPTLPTSPTRYTIPLDELADMTAEKVMGQASASVSIIAYSSLTCPHCATFHLVTLPLLKASYIDGGNVKLIYRDYPVPGAATQAAAYAAGSIARCVGSNRYFQALDMLYREQAWWTKQADVPSALKQVLASLNIPAEKMDACMISTTIQGEMTRQMNEGLNAYGVTGTPTLIINGQKLVGPTFAEIDAVLRTMLK